MNRNNLKEITLDEKKKVLVDVLTEIDTYCRENNIHYFLLGGSLIGAVRHNGFIPWDDDIDIGMLRKDYERFVSGYSGNSGRTKVVDFRNCKHYIWPMAKVIHTDTLLYENNYTRVDLGVNVDVFPLDGVPGSLDDAKKYLKKINKYRDILTLKHLIISKRRSLIKNMIVIMGKVLYIIPDSWLLKKIDSISRRYENNECDYVCSFAGAWREIAKKSIFTRTIPHRFENGEYPLPAGYDEYLRGVYGDYMQFPPKEKQVTHHGSIAYWKG